MRKLTLATAAAFLTLTAGAYAQDAVIVTEPGTVITEPGTVVVEPGTRVVELPGEVRTYVMERDVPSVAYEGDVLVGEILPETVETHVVDGYGNYAYTVVNERRVVVDPQTRQVIQVLD